MKTKTRNLLLLCIGIIISRIVAFMFPQLAYVSYGVLAFVIGSVALNEDWKKGKILRPIVFVIAIVCGGLLTTKGWNALRDYSQKKAIITSLAREWIENEIYQHVEPLFFEPNDPNLGEKGFTYIPFKTFASNSIMTSNLFNLQDKDERELCQKAMFYEITATNCNIMFTLFDWDITRLATTKERRKEVYKLVVVSSQYRFFKELHNNIEVLLKKRYNWAFEEALLFLDPKTQKAIKEKSKWPIE
jgi:hypothetical protein